MSGLSVISGPTAVGKGTVVRYLLEHFDDVHLSVSATTREPRPGEVDGVDYFFLTEDEFKLLIEARQMLEYAIVHGKNYYGTPRQPVETAIAAGKHVILEIDVQGARQVKASRPETRTIFIAPPTWDDLVARLRGRGTESAQEQAIRLETARVELEAQSEFDHVVINDEVARCAHEVLELMQA
jgi:guanylate kinase